MSSTTALPPWGVLSSAIQFSMGLHPVPDAWEVSLPSTSRRTSFEEWRDGVVEELAAMLWPTYDASRQCWSREPDPKLIESDFEILAHLHGHLERTIKGSGTCSDTFGEHACIHRTFFDEEDDCPLGLRYERYDPDLPERFRKGMPDLLSSGIGRTVGTLHYQLKQRFQRPRSYQVALLEQRQLDYIWAKSGGTPSFVSGHCLQGSMGGCAVFAQFDGSVSEASVEIFKQFTVDIGDRRVFAGVHYPSDNMASWYTALKLIPHVFDPSVAWKMQVFLYDAIRSKSDVYGAMVAHGKGLSSSPYHRALEAMEKAAHTRYF